MIRLAVRVPRAAAEIVLAELLELSPAGLEETDVSEGVVAYALYGAEGELPDVGALRAAAEASSSAWIVRAASSVRAAARSAAAIWASSDVRRCVRRRARAVVERVFYGW